MGSKCKHKNIQRCKEYVSMDSYIFTVYCLDCGKIIVSEWTAKEAEEKLRSLGTQ